MKRVCILLAVCLLFLPLVLGVETNVIVNTVPNHEFTIAFFDSTTSEVTFIENDKVLSSPNGSYVYVFDSDVEEVFVRVFLYEFGEKILMEDFEDIVLGEGDVVLDVYPKDYDIPEVKEEPVILEVNDSNSSETNTEINSTDFNENLINETELSIQESPDEETNGLVHTGNTVEGNYFDSVENILYYVFGGMFILGVLVFFIVKGLKSRKEDDEEFIEEEEEEEESDEEFNESSEVNDSKEVKKEIKVKKLSELKEELEAKNSRQKEIEMVEKKLLEAQKELERLKQNRENNSN